MVSVTGVVICSRTLRGINLLTSVVDIDAAFVTTPQDAGVGRMTLAHAYCGLMNLRINKWGGARYSAGK